MIRNALIYPGMCAAVLGFGISGRAALRYFAQCGAEVIVSDIRRRAELSAEEEELLEKYAAAYEGGGHTPSFLRRAEKIFVSPGIPKGEGVLGEAKEAGKIVGELALAGPALRAPVVAITGTNGKTTVTSLLGELLRQSGKRVFVGGNIGVPLFDFLAGGDDADVIVLEASSFQLEHSGDFRPDIALLLNITPDHLDWHGSFAEYISAKSRIFSRQRKEDVLIYCGDDPECCRIVEDAKYLQKRRVFSFGCAKDGDVRIREGEVHVCLQGEEQNYDLSETSMSGRTGLLNCAAAIIGALLLGCRKKAIQKGLEGFSPPSHRMERIGEYRGVTYINDSKATNTGAVIAALEQLEGGVILIVGGRDKGDDYSLLFEAVAKKAVLLVLIGEAADKIAGALRGAAPLVFADSVEKAVVRAANAATGGDTVLFSPACASFDMFESYAHRGMFLQPPSARCMKEGETGRLSRNERQR